MKAKQWSHTRRPKRVQHDDPIDWLIDESVSAATSGKIVKAMRLVRFAEQLTIMRKKRRASVEASILLSQLKQARQPAPTASPPPAPTPPPSPPAPPPAPYYPPPRPDPLAFTPEEEARFAAIRALQEARSSNDSA